MKHVARFSVLENNFKPYAVSCSCGVGGSFASQDEARMWMQDKHFEKLGGVSTTEFVDEQMSEVEAPPPPTESPELWKQPKQENPKIPVAKKNGEKGEA